MPRVKLLLRFIRLCFWRAVSVIGGPLRVLSTSTVVVRYGEMVCSVTQMVALLGREGGVFRSWRGGLGGSGFFGLGHRSEAGAHGR